MPPGDRDSAVLITGSQWRHLRLGYLVQERHPGLVRHWWTVEPGARPGKSRGGPSLSMMARHGLQLLRRGQIRELRWHAAQVLRPSLGGRKVSFGGARRAQRERRLFAGEVQRMEADAAVHPEPIASPNDEQVVEAVRRISPYFLLVLGGPLLRAPLLDAVRGVALNQHAGWSPEFKGASTTEMTLYHRQLERVGSTVHLVNTAADAGPILRRSSVTLHPDDSVDDCFLSVVSLGTDLMLEVLEDLRTASELVTYQQPDTGSTFRVIDFSVERRRALGRDFGSGWIDSALREVQRW